MNLTPMFPDCGKGTGKTCSGWQVAQTGGAVFAWMLGLLALMFVVAVVIHGIRHR